MLRDLDWADEYLEYCFKVVLTTEVNGNLGKVKGRFDKPYLKKLESYLDALYLKWVKTVSD